MSTATTAFAGGEKKIVFGCEWYFKPEGVKAVKKRFERELAKQKMVAHHEWNNDDQSFRIRCVVENSDSIWQTFLRVIRDLIRQETGDTCYSDDESESDVELEDSQDEGQPLRSNKIQHLSAWKRENGIIDTNSDNSHELARDSYQPMLGLDFPEKIKFYKEKTTWECAHSYLDDVVPDEMLRTLADLTGCEFAKDVNQGRIYIGSSSVEQCCLAVCKLENIRKNSGLNVPYVKHIFYTEDTENFRVMVKSLADSKKKFFKTTLLDNLQLSQANDYQNLQHALTVRCAAYNTLRAHFVPFKIEKFVPAIKTDLEKHSGPREWIEFKYSSYVPKGREEENSMTRYEYYERQQYQQTSEEQPSQQNSTEGVAQPRILENEKQEDDIQCWATLVPRTHADIPTTSFSNAKNSADRFGNLKREHETGQKARDKKPNWDTYNPYSTDTDDNKDEKQNYYRAPRATTGVSDFQQYKTVSLVTGEISALPLSIKPPQWKELPTSTDSVAPIDTGSKPDLLQQSPIITPVLDATKHVKHEWNEPDDLLSFFCSADENTLLDENISFLGSKFAVLEPVKKFSTPSLHSTVQSLSVTPSGAGITSSFTTQASYSEALQETSERETRSFYFTMNQKAPSPNKQQSKPNTKAQKPNQFSGRLPAPSPTKPCEAAQHINEETVDPVPEFLRDIDVSFEELVRGIRWFQGKVVVQAEFGRLLLRRIHPRYVAREDSELSNDPEELSSILNLASQDHGGATMVYFSNILTILPADAAFLVDMKDREGQRMWEKRQSSRDVYYEFLCRDTRETGYFPFTVEIDGERLGLGARIKTRREFGAINVHGTKRNWDFRIAAVGFETNEKNDKAYGDLATAIISTLHIPAGLCNPMLFFEIEDKLAHFQIFGVRVHRVCRYHSRDGKSVLKTSEVRELELHPLNGYGCISYKANGSTTPRVGRKWLDCWHEVSISCGKADEMFDQNRSIELGEEVSWTPEKLAKVDAAPAMYLPACEMLKQMDGIGYYNDNGLEIPAGITSTLGVQPPNPVPYQFW